MKEQVVGHYASHQHGVVRRRPLPEGLIPPPAPPTRPEPRRSRVRDTKEFLDAFYSVVNEGTRTLSAADAQGRKRWWKGLIRMDRRGLEVGFVFDLRSERSPMGEHLGRYRVVAMAIAPEGYVAVVGYADDWQPANGRPVPEVDLTQLVPS